MSVQRTVATIARYGRELLPIAFLAEAQEAGFAGGLVTITGIDGGAPKSPGTQMAVLVDGRYAGHVSGGCVESALASEVVPILMGGADRVIRFGKGSSYIDIRFPCGGGVDLLIHTAPSAEVLREALLRAEKREAFALAFDPAASRATIVDANVPTAWRDGLFLRRYLPRTRLVLAGRGPDFEVMARVAAAAEFELCLVTPDSSSADALRDLGVPIEVLGSARQPMRTTIDPWTATVLLFHEHEFEDAILIDAASSPGFYLGALGSQRTHRLRCERLASMNVPSEQIGRIRGPIGIVERTKDAGSLALSVLAEVTAARAELERN